MHSAEPQGTPSAQAGGADIKKKDRLLPISILIAAVLVSGSLVFTTVYKGGAAVPAPAAGTGQPAGAVQPAVDATAVMKLGDRDAILGNANAPVTLIEYGDYQCPFCTQFFSTTMPQILTNYINAGKVRMVFRNFAFLGPESNAAAAAAECAEDQNQLWAYHDALYSAKISDEQKGGSENDGFYNRALFLKLAGQTKLNVAAFTTCLDSNKYAAQIQSERTTAGTMGVDSTPNFFVNGSQIQGAQPYSVFRQVIDPLL